GLGVGEAMLLAEGAVESQDELADEGPVRGVVVIAEEREPQPLRREAAPQPGPALPGRALGPVLDQPLGPLRDLRADGADPSHRPIGDAIRARVPTAVVILLAHGVGLQAGGEVLRIILVAARDPAGRLDATGRDVMVGIVLVVGPWREADHRVDPEEAKE